MRSNAGSPHTDSTTAVNSSTNHLSAPSTETDGILSSKLTVTSKGKTWGPLKNPNFRKLWTAWLIANVCMWMFDVSAAWVMVTIADQNLFVALVQTASTLPICLFALPFGVVSDFFDRRHLFFITLLWLFGVACALAIASQTDALSPWLLLALIFINGSGMALRWTSFSALLPDVVSREELPQALALHSMAVNGSRIIGPMLAGIFLATLGATFIFWTGAIFSAVAVIVVWRWHFEKKGSEGPCTENFIKAMWTGLKFSYQSSELRATIILAFLLCLELFSLVALLPLAAKEMKGGGAETYTMLFTFLGVGAIAIGMAMPKLRAILSSQSILFLGSLMLAAAIGIVSIATSPWLAGPAVFVAGGTWLAISNSLGVSAQLSLPGWARARGMAIFMMAAMGGSALGAALFGAIADRIGVSGSLSILSAMSFALVWPMRRLKVLSPQ